MLKFDGVSRRFGDVVALDEFVIAFFTIGNTDQTLPIVIYSMIRFGVTPKINALAAILLLVSFTAVIAGQRLTKIGESRAQD